MTTALRTEIDTYNQNLGNMMEHVGKYVLIKDTEVIDFFDAYEDALKDGYRRYNDALFFVKCVAPAEHVSFFTRDLVTQCRA